MNRRDIIIVATLVNAGLLSILFMMAVTSEDLPVHEYQEAHRPLVELKQEAVPLAVSKAKTGYNEVALSPVTVASLQEALPVVADPYEEPKAKTKDLPALHTITSDSATAPVEVTKGAAATKPAKPAAPTMDQGAAKSTQWTEVTVKKGDSLDKIAKTYGTNVKALKEVNNLKSDRLDIGQQLKVPAGTTKTAKVTTKPKESNQKLVAEATPSGQGAAQYYTVQSGDSPWKIAKKYNMSTEELLKLNGMSEEKARSLKPGDKLRVR